VLKQAAVPILAFGLLFPVIAARCEPFSRKQADPGTESKVARMTTRGQRKDGGSLKSSDATRFAVRTDCGPVQVGGTAADQRQPDSLLRQKVQPRESNTVTGETVVICRR
jgi:hypothetical protein